MLQVETVLLITACLTLFYIYGKWKNRFFKRLGIPGPEPTVLIGNLYQILKRGIVFDDEEYEKYGKVYGLSFGGVNMLCVMDVEILRHIFIKNFQNFQNRFALKLDDFPIDHGLFFQEGQKWKRSRRILSPTFSGSKLRHMSSRINICAETLTNNYIKMAATQEEFDVKQYMGAFTIDVIASTAFGIEIDSQNNLDNEFLVKAKSLFSGATLGNPVMFLAMLFPSMRSVFRALGFSMFPKKTLNFFVKILQEMLEQRKQNQEEKPNDFFQLLIDAEDPTEEGNQKMSAAELMGQAMLFFLAGYETTANTLHYTVYSLATNPDIQRKLAEEIDSVLGDTEPTYDNIGDLVYLDHVITETLRLYPIVPQLSRIAIETIIINGVTIPKGLAITVPVFALHRDHDVYPEPHEFKPERWYAKSEMDPMYYLPFGQGPRNCIGMRLAQVEMKIALIHMIRKVEFIPAADTPKRLEGKDFIVTGLFNPKKPINLRVRLR